MLTENHECRYKLYITTIHYNSQQSHLLVTGSLRTAIKKKYEIK